MIKKIIPLLCFGLAACHNGNVAEVQTTLVKDGTFSEVLTEQGTIQAVNSIAISAPTISYRYGSLKITGIVEDGKEVSRGDTIVVFDPAEVKRAIITSQQQLEIANAEFEKLQAIQESEIEDLEAELKITRISQEIAKINFEQAVYESEVTKKEINLKLESSNIALIRAQEQIDNKKKIQKEELFQKTLSIRQLKVALLDATNSINSLFIISPVQGIAIRKENWMSGQKWNIGDQPYSGSNIIDLPDLSVMRAEVKINEVDVSKIIPGQKVEIKPDAYSDSTYSGKITTVANLAQNKDYKSKIKVFPVQIIVEGKSKQLMPGLSVSCKIIISETPDVLYIPLDAVFEDQGTEFVYIKYGKGFKRRDIKIGATNTDFAIVTQGVNENDELALTDPFLNKEENKENSGTDPVIK
jgi:multidrug efflux pump subunit AcrA (membrane-fusion protein)